MSATAFQRARREKLARPVEFQEAEGTKKPEILKEAGEVKEVEIPQNTRARKRKAKGA